MGQVNGLVAVGLKLLVGDVDVQPVLACMARCRPHVLIVLPSDEDVGDFIVEKIGVEPPEGKNKIEDELDNDKSNSFNSFSNKNQKNKTKQRNKQRNKETIQTNKQTKKKLTHPIHQTHFDSWSLGSSCLPFVRPVLADQRQAFRTR